MSKKVLVFDLDGTLAPSKSDLPERIGQLLNELLEQYKICVISGGTFGQFTSQLLKGLDSNEERLANLHLMPTCGTQYYTFRSGDWNQVYAENFSKGEKQKILEAFSKGVKTLGYEEARVYGDVFEDRGSQITFSAYGQDIITILGEEGLRMKEAWDPDVSKRNKLRDYVADLIPEFEVRVGGITSVDITKPGIDKAYGMKKLIDILKLGKEDILFFGDRLQPGGNDYPVKEFGIDCIEVSHWQDTVEHLEAILQSSREV